MTPHSQTYMNSYSVGMIFGGSLALELLGNYTAFTEFLNSQDFTEDDSLLLGLKLLLNTVVDEQKRVLEGGPPFYLKSDLMTKRAIHRGCPMVSVPSNSCMAQALRGLEQRTKSVLGAQTLQSFFETVQHEFGGYASIVSGLYEKNLTFLEPSCNLEKKTALSFHSLEFLADVMETKLLKLPLKSGGTDFALGERTAAFRKGGLFERMFVGHKTGVSYLWLNIGGIAMNENPWADVLACGHWKEFSSVYQSTVRKRIEETEKYYGIKTGIGTAAELEGIDPTILEPIFDPISPDHKLSTKERLDAEFLWYDFQILDGGNSKIYPGVPTFIFLLEGLARAYETGRLEHPAQVRRIRHPLPNNPERAEISYALLIPCIGTVWSDVSGWVLHLDCCNSFTGGAWNLMKQAEEQIEYLAEFLDVREISLNRDKFERYISRHIEMKSRSLGVPLTRPELATFVLDASDALSAAFIELFMATSMAEQGYQVEWQYRNKKTIKRYEIDVLAWKGNEAHMIECSKSIPKGPRGITRLVNELNQKRNLLKRSKFSDFEIRCRIVTTEDPDHEDMIGRIEKLRNEGIEVDSFYDLMHNSKHKTKQLERLLTRIQAARRTEGNLFFADMHRKR